MLKLVRVGLGLAELGFRMGSVELSAVSDAPRLEFASCKYVNVC